MYEDLYNGALKQIQKLEEVQEQLNRKVEQQASQIAKQTEVMAQMHQTIEKLEGKFKATLGDKDKQIIVLQANVTNLTRQLVVVNQECDKWRGTANLLEINVERMEKTIFEKD